MPVELNARYLDALALLVREQGRLVSKDRFLDEVWRGVPVTDEALTQCIKTLRRQLGDDAVSPRFIETVPKHGYRFIAPVEADRRRGRCAGRARRRGRARLAASSPAGGRGHDRRRASPACSAGCVYGFAGAVAAGRSRGMGAVSVLLVLLCADDRGRRWSAGPGWASGSPRPGSSRAGSGGGA